MWRQIAPAFRVMIFFTILIGLVYPGVVTGLCQLFFPKQANGSMVKVKGKVIGSSLIGQAFSKPWDFHPRPSAAGTGYDASNSGASNYGPTNVHLIGRVKASIKEFRKENPGYHGPIPADMVTASGSGLDPDISPASAFAQAPRIARARRLPLRQVHQLIASHIQEPMLGFIGEPRVNVLELNLALDRLSARR